jgi:hypothetical protein
VLSPISAVAVARNRTSKDVYAAVLVTSLVVGLSAFLLLAYSVVVFIYLVMNHVRF